MQQQKAKQQFLLRTGDRCGSDRIIIIEGGRIVMDGPRDEVLANLKGAQA